MITITPDLCPLDAKENTSWLWQQNTSLDVARCPWVGVGRHTCSGREHWPAGNCSLALLGLIPLCTRMTENVAPALTHSTSQLQPDSVALFPNPHFQRCRISGLDSAFGLVPNDEVLVRLAGLGNCRSWSPNVAAGSWPQGLPFSRISEQTSLVSEFVFGEASNYFQS